jgi:alpha-amylase
MDNYQIIHFHHPIELNKLSFLDIGLKKNHIDQVKTDEKFKAQFKQTIKPRLKTILKMAGKETKPLVYFSISFLDQLEANDRDLLMEIQEHVNKEQIILVGSCAYHSFSYLSSQELFQEEAILHKKLLKGFFKPEPEIFINTACLFDDDIATIVQNLGYKSIIATANTWHLDGKHSGQLYKANTSKEFAILLSNGDEPDNFQISLINGYGSAYSSNQIDENIKNSTNIQELFLQEIHTEKPTYAVSMPLTSPSWEHKIPDYTNNPLQKALIQQIADLFRSKGPLTDSEDLKTLMLLCQPENLMSINQFSKENGYNQFISSMNILTDLSLKYNK